MGFESVENESSQNEKTFEIVHLPNMDVVVNLDYPNKEDVQALLKVLESDTDFSEQLMNIYDAKESENKRFFVKGKSKYRSRFNVDFILGKPDSKDSIQPEFRDDFDTRARYGVASVLNEIIMSRKVREVIISGSAQEIAKKFGFDRLDFAEVILSIVTPEEKMQKRLVYPHVDDNKKKDIPVSDLEGLALDLRKLFLEKGIVSSDLLGKQFLVNEKDGELVATLIDIEAYRTLE